MPEVAEVSPVVRASYAVLLAVGNAGPVGANVHDVCRAVGLSKRSAYRHLRSLRALGMVEATTAETGRFHLGAAAVGLAVRASDQRAFLRRAHVFADELTELTGEPVHVTVYDHGTSVTVATASADVVRSTDTVPIAVGSRRPAHASASGKVFLGYNSAALTAYLLRPLQAFTERTIVDAGELRAECARIRARGWSTDAQENTLGVSCVAVPVWGMTDRVVGSLVVSTRQTEMSDSAREELLGLLTPAAEEFSRAVGGAQR